MAKVRREKEGVVRADLPVVTAAPNADLHARQFLSLL